MQPGGPNTLWRRDCISIHHQGDVLPLREVEIKAMNCFQRLLMCAQSRADDDGLHPPAA